MKRKLINAFPIALFAFAGRALSVGRIGAWTALDASAATLLALAVLPVAAYASGAVFGGDGIIGINGIGGKILYAFFSAGTMAAAFCIAVISAKEFSNFAAEVMFLRVPVAVVTVIFLGFCAYLASTGFGTLRKFSLVAFWITASAAIMLFLLSVPNFDVSNAEALLEGIGVSAEGTINAFGGIFAPAAVAVIYMSASGDRKERGVSLATAAVSVLLAAALLAVCYLNVCLLLGESFGASRQYPYSDAVSTVTAGKLFARMEGFAYVMYYAASAVKTAVSVSLICLLAKRMLPPKWVKKKLFEAMPYAVAAALAATTMAL